MDVAELLADAFGRVHDAVHHLVDGLSPAQLTARPDPDANSVAWLVWHLSRVQDDHLAKVAGCEQVWTDRHFYERFALPFDRAATGYGQSSAEVGAVAAPADLLVGYHDAVHEATLAYLHDLGPGELDRVVDDSYDPPVTLGVRLVSVLTDDLQHAGQAAYVRGLAERADH